MNTRHYFVIFLTSILLSRATSPLDSWVEIDRPLNTGPLIAVDFGNGVFVAGGQGGTILTSTDGANWTPRISGVNDNIRRIKFVHGRFFADHGPDEPSITYKLGLMSTDGISWEAISPL